MAMSPRCAVSRSAASPKPKQFHWIWRLPLGIVSPLPGIYCRSRAALDDIPALALTAGEAARLRHGQPIVLTEGEGARLDRFDDGTIVGARHDQLLIGLARIENRRLRPVRIINC